MHSPNTWQRKAGQNLAQRRHMARARLAEQERRRAQGLPSDDEQENQGTSRDTRGDSRHSDDSERDSKSDNMSERGSESTLTTRASSYRCVC